MGFTNPIASAGGALIREALRSPGYVPGAAGWTINEDGTAEFQSIVIGAGSGVVTDAELAAAVDPLAAEADLVAAPGQEALNRTALKSTNYEPGVSGWRITQGGNVEFGAGIFRGTVRSLAISAKVKRSAAVLNVAPGRYVLNSMSLDYDLGPDIDSYANRLTPTRAGIYLVVGYLPLETDASLASLGAELRYGTGGPGAPGSALLVGSVVNNQPAGAQVGFNLCFPARLVANQSVWMEGITNVQCDWLGGAALALHYLSENA